MTAAAVMLGAGCGAGVWALAVWLFPPRPSLAAQLARALDPPALPEPETQQARGWPARLGAPFVPVLTSLGLPGPRLVRDLRITSTTVSEHLAVRSVLALAGLLTPGVAQLVMFAAGVPLGIELPLAGGLVLAAAGFVLPELHVRHQATALRDGFRHALSAYLDLVWITLAGGSGVDGALNGSVRIGRGWAFDRIAEALATAQLTRVSAWTALRRLGEDLEVNELAELAGTVSLAGTEGARVRASLAARAASLRAHQITDAEARAQSATERMALPVMVLFLGFLTFIAYPALGQILDGL